VRDRGRAPGVVAGLACLAAALALTWPLALHLGDSIPLGSESVETVPLFNVWTLDWNARSIERGYAGYWDAPIFHPARGAFALSEPQPLAGLVAAPISWSTGRPALAYNLVLVVALATNGWLAWRWLFVLGTCRSAAAAGAVLMLSLPFVVHELGVLQLVPLAGVLLFFAALERLGREPTAMAGALVGVTYALTYWLCGYYALLLVPIAATAGLVLAWPRAQPRRWARAVTVAVAVAAAAIAPLGAGQLASPALSSMERGRASLERNSARLGDYLTASGREIVPIARAAGRGDHPLFPGALRLSLASIGALWALRSARWRRRAIFLLLLGTVALFTSLGPNLSIAGWTPYEGLAAAVPGFGRLRSLARFALFVHLALALLGALAIEALSCARGARIAALGAVVVVLLATIELHPGAQRLTRLPRLDASMPWLEAIEKQTAPDAAIAFLPFPRGRLPSDYRQTAQWMYWQLRHRRPMVNGYSGYFPADYRRLKEAMVTFPSRESLDQLATAGAATLVVLRAYATPAEFTSHPLTAGRFELLAADDANGIDVYRVVGFLGAPPHAGPPS
jgi:hypothetical protein